MASELTPERARTNHIQVLCGIYQSADVVGQIAALPVLAPGLDISSPFLSTLQHFYLLHLAAVTCKVRGFSSRTDVLTINKDLWTCVAAVSRQH